MNPVMVILAFISGLHFLCLARPGAASAQTSWKAEWYKTVKAAEIEAPELQ